MGLYLLSSESQELVEILEKHHRNHPPENIVGFDFINHDVADTTFARIDMEGLTLGNTTLTESDVIQLKEIIDERQRKP